MSKIAVVFPGQGAQYPGMGKELYESSKAARRVFARLEPLRPGLTELCFYGSSEELSKTNNTQPCLYAAALAAAEALKEAGVRADLCAGFSLGELCAVVYADALSLEEGFSLVLHRGRLMHGAAEALDCCMAAVVRLSGTETERIAAQFQDVYPVNYNSPQQTVVSCREERLEAFSQAVAKSGGRAIRLNVGGGFHSPFMRDAAQAFQKVLDGYVFRAPNVPVYANVDAVPYADDFPDKLTRQLICPVLWQRTIERMKEDGATLFIEAGAGSVLKGMIQKTLAGTPVFSSDEGIKGIIDGIKEKKLC